MLPTVTVEPIFPLSAHRLRRNTVITEKMFEEKIHEKNKNVKRIRLFGGAYDNAVRGRVYR